MNTYRDRRKIVEDVAPLPWTLGLIGRKVTTNLRIVSPSWKDHPWRNYPPSAIWGDTLPYREHDWRVSGCLTGIGKLNYVTVKLHVVPNTPGAVQKQRRVSISLKEKFYRILDRWLSRDIIEDVGDETDRLHSKSSVLRGTGTGKALGQVSRWR